MEAQGCTYIFGKLTRAPTRWRLPPLGNVLDKEQQTIPKSSRKFAKTKLPLRYCLNKSKLEHHPWPGLYFAQCGHDSGAGPAAYWKASRPHRAGKPAHHSHSQPGRHGKASRDSTQTVHTHRYKPVLWKPTFHILTRFGFPARTSCPAHCQTFEAGETAVAHGAKQHSGRLSALGWTCKTCMRQWIFILKKINFPAFSQVTKVRC